MTAPKDEGRGESGKGATALAAVVLVAYAIRVATSAALGLISGAWGPVLVGGAFALVPLAAAAAVMRVRGRVG